MLHKPAVDKVQAASFYKCAHVSLYTGGLPAPPGAEERLFEGVWWSGVEWGEMEGAIWSGEMRACCTATEPLCISLSNHH